MAFLYRENRRRETDGRTDWCAMLNAVPEGGAHNALCYAVSVKAAVVSTKQ